MQRVVWTHTQYCITDLSTTVAAYSVQTLWASSGAQAHSHLHTRTHIHTCGDTHTHTHPCTDSGRQQGWGWDYELTGLFPASSMAACLQESTNSWRRLRRKFLSGFSKCPLYGLWWKSKWESHNVLKWSRSTTNWRRKLGRSTETNLQSLRLADTWGF